MSRQSPYLFLAWAVFCGVVLLSQPLIAATTPRTRTNPASETGKEKAWTFMIFMAADNNLKQVLKMI